MWTAFCPYSWTYIGRYFPREAGLGAPRTSALKHSNIHTPNSTWILPFPICHYCNGQAVWYSVCTGHQSLFIASMLNRQCSFGEDLEIGEMCEIWARKLSKQWLDVQRNIRSSTFGKFSALEHSTSCVDSLPSLFPNYNSYRYRSSNGAQNDSPYNNQEYWLSIAVCVFQGQSAWALG